MHMLYEQLKARNCLEPRDNNQCQAERKKPTLPFYLLPAAPASIHLWI